MSEREVSAHRAIEQRLAITEAALRRRPLHLAEQYQLIADAMELLRLAQSAESRGGGK
jgi:hypothetical protein